MSPGLADSQAALARGGQIPGPAEEGGKNTCPFCLPSWARSVHQVEGGMHLIAGGEAERINTL